MTVLIAGGTGFIGSHLARALLRQGERVVLLGRTPGNRLIGDIASRVTFVRGDATSLADVLHAIKDHGISDVYHLIALLADVSQREPLSAFKANTESTLNFLEAARILGLRRVIYASSVAVYDPAAAAPVSESAPLRPASVYGETKVASEFYGMHYQRSFGVDFRALRFTTLYGPGKTGGSTGICSTLIEHSALGQAVDVDAADAVTDWLYIKDAVRSLLLARDVDAVKARIYNIGAGSYSVREVAEVVQRLVPDARITLRSERTFPWPPAYDCRKAREELGYVPTFGIEDGIRDFIADVRAAR
ncbi:MAG TPA: NAD(P)-dependent oxidoreductase [Burkholderiales bacterium]|nr:NAD(P)-dependent oxidoreductase [Burkholderiales bacterium]